jgi:hypothetical protein
MLWGFESCQARTSYHGPRCLSRRHVVVSMRRHLDIMGVLFKSTMIHGWVGPARPRQWLGDFELRLRARSSVSVSSLDEHEDNDGDECDGGDADADTDANGCGFGEATRRSAAAAATIARCCCSRGPGVTR